MEKGGGGGEEGYGVRGKGKKVEWGCEKMVVVGMMVMVGVGVELVKLW